MTVFNHVRERLQVVHSSPAIMQGKFIASRISLTPWISENEPIEQNGDAALDLRRTISADNETAEPVHIFVPNTDEGDDEP